MANMSEKHQQDSDIKDARDQVGTLIPISYVDGCKKGAPRALCALLHCIAGACQRRTSYRECILPMEANEAEGTASDRSSTVVSKL